MRAQPILEVNAIPWRQGPLQIVGPDAHSRETRAAYNCGELLSEGSIPDMSLAEDERMSS
jgi:hypothetical protein